MVILIMQIISTNCTKTHEPPTINIPEEMFLTIPELIKHWGYPVETHQVLTDDGYYLTMHRIPHGRHQISSTQTSPGVKGVMLLVPGLLLDSSVFLTNLPHQSLGFVLADNG